MPESEVGAHTRAPRKSAVSSRSPGKGRHGAERKRKACRPGTEPEARPRASASPLGLLPLSRVTNIPPTSCTELSGEFNETVRENTLAALTVSLM